MSRLYSTFLSASKTNTVSCVVCFQGWKLSCSTQRSPWRPLNFHYVDWMCSVFLLYLFLVVVCFWLCIISDVFVLAFCSTFCIRSTFPLLYLFWISVRIFELASFLKLQHISPIGKVRGRCSVSALVGHWSFCPFHKEKNTCTRLIKQSVCRSKPLSATISPACVWPLGNYLLLPLFHLQANHV